jgi:hypothetical protein
MNEKLLLFFAFALYCTLQTVMLKVVVRVLGGVSLSWRKSGVGGGAIVILQWLLLLGLSGSCYTAYVEVFVLSFFVYGLIIHFVCEPKDREKFNHDNRYMLALQALACVILNAIALYFWSAATQWCRT